MTFVYHHAQSYAESQHVAADVATVYARYVDEMWPTLTTADQDAWDHSREFPGFLRGENIDAAGHVVDCRGDSACSGPDEFGMCSCPDLLDPRLCREPVSR